jgi:hypothetical protein
VFDSGNAFQSVAFSASCSVKLALGSMRQTFDRARSGAAALIDPWQPVSSSRLKGMAQSQAQRFEKKRCNFMVKVPQAWASLCFVFGLWNLLVLLILFFYS